SILRAVEGMMAAAGLQPSLRAALERLAAVLDEQQYEARVRRLSARVRALFDGPTAAGRSQALTLGADEPGTRAGGAALDAMDDSTRTRWHALLLHCTLARASKPSATWIKDARSMVEAIGATAVSAPL